MEMKEWSGKCCDFRREVFRDDWWGNEPLFHMGLPAVRCEKIHND